MTSIKNQNQTTKCDEREERDKFFQTQLIKTRALTEAENETRFEGGPPPCLKGS